MGDRRRCRTSAAAQHCHPPTVAAVSTRNGDALLCVFASPVSFVLRLVRVILSSQRCILEMSFIRLDILRLTEYLTPE